MGATTSTHLMECMEVWGGNQAINNGVVVPGLDVWVYSSPYEDQSQGGDIHYVSSCATGRITRILVADVSGHGMEVAGIASQLRRLMRRYVNFMDQARFVEGVNQEFTSLGADGKFATAVAATFWAPTRLLTLCNAGHPRPLLYRARTGRWTVCAQSEDDRAPGVSNIPLGITSSTYDQLATRLHRGDLVIFYTDSLIEAADASGRQVGEAGLLKIARNLDATRPEEIVASILNEVLTHRGGEPLEDDATMIIIRTNDLRLRRTPGDFFKMASLFARAIFGKVKGGGPVPWPEWNLVNIGGAFIDRLNRRWGFGVPEHDAELEDDEAAGSR